MNYTKEKLEDKHYKINVIIDGEEHTFQCIVANDTEADLDEIVQWNIDNLNKPFVEPSPSYADKRKSEYPPIEDYLDGIVKNNTAQIQAYVDACKEVKAKYPK